MNISVFDIIKIGIGPSSSHTMGPWVAAQLFLAELEQLNTLTNVQEIYVHLYGSLAKTGVGHGTDMAIKLALQGENYKTIDPKTIPKKIESIGINKKIMLNAKHEIPFDEKKHIYFDYLNNLPKHPNGLSFKALMMDGTLIEKKYYSVGGGFVETDENKQESIDNTVLELPYDTALEVEQHCELQQLNLTQFIIKNELHWRNEAQIKAAAMAIWFEIKQCIHRGVNTSGILPGGLFVKRRAEEINNKLLDNKNTEHLEDWIKLIKYSQPTFTNINKWISCFALAVNEENASFGRIVTAPTNGAAGVVPAVLMYAYCFTPDFDDNKAIDFILVSGLVGILFKKKATISAAMGGCQAEIGVSSAMAAAALTFCVGGSTEQSFMAAEIAMEHHLGMTCDPIGGLVQIPCIERNSMGAIKAITASNIAIESDPKSAIVSLDNVIKTMWQTALDMNSKYKETSEAGLAVNIPVNVAEC
jgi:L-serine dehydratase